MLATFKYRPRNTFIQRLDPRTRFIFMVCVIFSLTIPDIWDYRIIMPLFLLSLTLFLMARIEWRDVRRTLLYMFILVFFIVGLNGVLSGRGGPSSVLSDASPVVFQVPFVVPGADGDWMVPVTISKIWFAINQILRMTSMALMAVIIPYTVDPNMYGTTFRRMGFSDKVSFTMDLAFRFLPTFTRDFFDHNGCTTGQRF